MSNENAEEVDDMPPDAVKISGDDEENDAMPTLEDEDASDLMGEMDEG